MPITARHKESKKRQKLRERVEIARESMLNATDRAQRMRWHDTYRSLALRLETLP